MHKTRLREPIGGAKLELEYTEMDPSGRYGCFREVLGKGAMKTVYKAFDEVLGMEMAWNQVKLTDIFRTPKELQRLYSEVHLLKNLDHQSIMRYHTSWIDVHRRTFNFITEMFTSGTLREYRQTYKRVNIRAAKNWALQILQGIAYMHGHDPPVIHRDLKCDNIFINGHLGQVKIGDLGLAAILRGSNHAHSVIGTPEFMAPELYEEEYDELVDIYSFGMCLLEMLTCEYPYGECSNPAQIYKKVTSGKLPDAFYRIQDVEAQRFVQKCLEPASKRPSAQELLMDPFLASIDEAELLLPIIPMVDPTHNSNTPIETMADLADLLPDSTKSTQMMITGTMDPVDDTIFLKVKIFGKHGQARNVYFPFDIVSDTAIGVATEMVKELEITDWEPCEIAQMIDEEISGLVPTWKDCDPKPHNHHQHSINYDGDEDEDDNDDKTHNPFYFLSSQSSSEASLPCFYAPSDTLDQSSNAMTSGYDWLQEDLIYNDDTSSQSSLNSYKCSNLKYCSGHESEFDSSQKRGKTVHLISKTHKCTRFCPEESICKNCNNKSNALTDTYRDVNSTNHERKISRMGSLVDIHSQLLHRSLVEEINKRRLFKTVGSVENIGYHEPGEICDDEQSIRGGFSKRSSHRRTRDHKHQFIL